MNHRKKDKQEKNFILILDDKIILPRIMFYIGLFIYGMYVYR